MIKTKLIIFDLDGTLLNTIGVITKALNKALVDFGFETYEEEDVKSKVGYGPRRLIEDSVPNIDAELREKIYKNKVLFQLGGSKNNSKHYEIRN